MDRKVSMSVDLLLVSVIVFFVGITFDPTLPTAAATPTPTPVPTRDPYVPSERREYPGEYVFHLDNDGALCWDIRWGDRDYEVSLRNGVGIITSSWIWSFPPEEYEIEVRSPSAEEQTAVPFNNLLTKISSLLESLNEL